MPHSRQRFIADIIYKRLKLWPVLGVLGPRQVGKSTLLRDQIAAKINGSYLTLDYKETRNSAAKQPQFFVEQSEGPLIIDEVQKVPDLFDAIKADVDIRRRPGRFIISGSSQFSAKAGIRESLTGRIGIIRLYPMTLAETESKSFFFPFGTLKSRLDGFTLKQVLKRLEQGGMPGTCFLRSPEEREASIEAWLDTTCNRDIFNLTGARYNGRLAIEILSVLAKIENPTLAELSAQLRVDGRKVRAHLEALECLFAVTALSAHRLGVGKTRYYLHDSAVARHLGASIHNQLLIWALNECEAQYAYKGLSCRVSYYTSKRRSQIDLLIETKNQLLGIIISQDEAVNTYTLRAADAFLKKAPQAKIIILAPIKQRQTVGKSIQVMPWHQIA